MGALWLLDHFNIIDRTLFCTGLWEEKQVERLTNLARQLPQDNGKALFLDVGSHAGFYAILMSKTGLFSRVLAFEPLPDHIAHLQSNLLLNDLVGFVETYAIALSDNSGMLHFSPGTKTNRGTAHVVDGRSMGAQFDAPRAQLIEVQASRLDDILPLKGAAAVLKIDVEGHEKATIDGMTGFLTANQCVVQVEVLPAAAERIPPLFAALGYTHLGAIEFDHYFTNSSAVKG